MGLFLTTSELPAVVVDFFCYRLQRPEVLFGIVNSLTRRNARQRAAQSMVFV